MEIFNDSGNAFECAMRRFLRQKSDDPVYLYRVTVARREMWVVLSTAEAKSNKVSTKSCYMEVNGQYGLLEAKQRRQESSKEDAKFRLIARAVRGYRQYHNAQEKLAKMERGADAPERPLELDTTEA